MAQDTFHGRLFEREAEQARLLETFERQIEYDAKRELILITGRSGTGKSALASTLQRTTKIRGGSYIKGKFDQFQRAEPYAPFKAAFTAFATSVVAQGPKIISRIKESLRENVDPMDATVLVNIVPALSPLLDTPETEIRYTSVFGADEAKRRERITAAFCNFTGSICSPERPLVILIDDLQWADSHSLRLLRALVTTDTIDGLVLVGTCRNNEVKYGDELAILLRQLEDDMNLKVNEFYLKNLDAKKVKRMISAIYINLNPSSLEALADFVFKTTNGNVFFALELLKYLEEEGCLCKDNDDIDPTWSYDEARVLNTKYGNNVRSLLVAKIRGLSTPIQEILQVAACLGSHFDEKLLHDLIDTTYLSEALEIATNKTLILKGDSPGSYMFAHDCIEHAVYSSISLEERSNYHLIIGRDLHNALIKRNELKDNIYLVVNQLQQGIELVKTQKEKNMIAELCLQAGKKALASSDYNAAFSYLEFGIGILDKNHWRNEYILSLSLYSTAAEVSFCLSNVKMMDTRIQQVFENARSSHDKVNCNKTYIRSLASKSSVAEAFKATLAVLNDLGEDLRQEAGMVKLVHEIAKTKALLMLQNRKIKRGLKLHRMTDPKHSAVMEMLNLAFIHATMQESKLTLLVVLRMMQFTLKHGSCTLTPVAFAAYGIVVCAMGSYSAGYRYGMLALDTLKQTGHSEWETRIFTMVYAIMWDWNQPMRLALKPLEKAIRLGYGSGDFDMVGYQYCVKLFYVAPLEQLASESKALFDKMRFHNNITLGSQYLQIILQLSDNFMGLSADPTVLTGNVMNEDAVIQEAVKAKHVRLEIALYVYSLIISFTFNDYERAFMLSRKAAALKTSYVSTFNICLLIFYEGLTSLALSKNATDPKQQREFCKVAKQSIRTMKRLGKQVPENCLHKNLLLEAEFDMLKGRYIKGLDKYHRCIELAKTEGFLHEHALACERLGLALYSQGTTKDPLSPNTAITPGEKYLVEACSLYKTWGTHAKVEQMKQCYSFLTSADNYSTPFSSQQDTRN